jgi:hypothetical protein
MSEEWLLCPACGWSGPASKVEGIGGRGSCPACEEAIRYQ